MDSAYEKKWLNEGNFFRENNPAKISLSLASTSSSAVLIDGPIHVQQAPVQIRHHFVFSLFSALCLCPATGRELVC